MRNYLNKNIPICFERVKPKRSSLNCNEVRANPFTFPSGERGPRGAVNEEEIISRNEKIKRLKKFQYVSCPILTMRQLVLFDFISQQLQLRLP